MNQNFMESMNNPTKIEYPYLPEGRTILYVPENNKYMLTAKKVAQTESTDIKTSIGAVIVGENGEILVSAANQSALKNKFLLNTHKTWCVRKLFKIPSGQKYWMCPGCASHKNHAEYRAVLALQKKFPQKVNQNLDLYLWGHWWCCKPCWDKMIEAGIKNVYLMEGTGNGFNNSNPIVSK
jgi:deoxycytidylate deaminase